MTSRTLWVNLDTLLTRLHTLTDRERRALSEALVACVGLGGVFDELG